MKKAFFRDTEFTVFDDVYEPDDDSFLMAEHVTPEGGSKVLDMGCGCGIAAVMAAKAGAKVTAADVNPSAVRNTQYNATQLGLAKKIKAVESDLFGNVKGKFDFIYFNPPYVPEDEDDARLREKHPQLSKSWDGGKDGRETIKRFLDEVGRHMHDGTQTFVIVSSHNDFDWFRAYAESKGFAWEIADERKLFFEVLSLFRISKR